MLSMDKSCSYEDLLILLLERKAEKLNIKRFKIYEFEELLSEVIYYKLEKNPDELGAIDKLAEKLDILPIFNKDEIILEIADIVFSKRD